MELEYVFVALGCLAIAIIAYTVYLNAITKVTIASSTAAAADAGTTKFMFFFSTWCPWSKKARPQWDAFRDDLKAHPMTYGGKTVILQEYDGDSHADLLKQHHVAGYPAFVLTTPGGDTQMTSLPTKETLRAFLVKSLGAEEPVKLPASTA